jgi:hypothetical protein
MKSILALDQAVTVRREKALVHSGRKALPELDRSARYYRSSGGGNKTAEASGGKVASGDSASLQVVTRANAEQASKLIMQELTQL